MSDIFEIKSTKIELRIADRVFEIKDPKFIAKVSIKKDWDSLSKRKESMDDSDYLLEAYELNKKTITTFIPTMDKEFIDNELSSSSIDLLLAKITELMAEKFGSSIEKTGKKP